MKQVFVETNWIVDCLAPVWFHNATATSLLQRHLDRVVEIHVPVVAIHEARKQLSKFSPSRVQEIHNLTHWLVEHQPDLLEPLNRAIAKGQSELQAFEKTREQRLTELHKTLGSAVFPYREEAMLLQVELAKERIQLKPFDQAILCSVVAEAQLSRENDASAETVFCTRDSDFHREDCKRFAEVRGVEVLRTFEV